MIEVLQTKMLVALVYLYKVPTEKLYHVCTEVVFR